ncbi:MAG: cupin domain-containing protein [Caldilineaceae bacterium]|nr:cupin domain-containing protein [Caldilineaceae bacterium]
MPLQSHKARGLTRYLLDADLVGEPIHVHISEVGPGQRSHPPHRHGGYEALYMLEGEGTLELDEERHRLGTNEAIVFDPQKLHGLLNHSDAPMKYLVVLAGQNK